MADAHKNFAFSTVATAPSPATSGLSLTVAAGHGTRFATPPFNLIVSPVNTPPSPENAEVIRCTGIAGDVLTILRAQETSPARAIGVGDFIADTWTAGTIAELWAAIGALDVATVSQAAAEAGASTSVYKWTPERIAQAIAALAPGGGGGGGDVTGPASAVADRIATYNSTTGKLIKDGGKTIAVVLSDAATDATTKANAAQAAAIAASQPLATVLTNTTAAFTTAQETKLANIEALADMTDAGNVAAAITGATAKTTPVDADGVGLIDSAAANVLKLLSWANIKATLRTYFDSLYPAGSGSSTGTNTGDNATNSQYSGLVSNATHTGDATGATALTVVKINGTSLAGLATGLLKNTTGTGVPSIAAAGTDYLAPAGSGAALTGITQPQVSGLTTADSPQFTGVNVGHATDTTITRVIAGVIAVEGATVDTISATNTLTNKRVTARITTITSSFGTPTVNTDNCDCVSMTGVSAAITSMTTNLTGTPVNFDQLEYRIKDDGTARAITWGATFISGPATLPTTTTVSKALHVYFEWDSVQSKWVCMSTGSDA